MQLNGTQVAISWTETIKTNKYLKLFILPKSKYENNTIPQKYLFPCRDCKAMKKKFFTELNPVLGNNRNFTSNKQQSAFLITEIPSIISGLHRV